MLMEAAWSRPCTPLAPGALVGSGAMGSGSPDCPLNGVCSPLSKHGSARAGIRTDPHRPHQNSPNRHFGVRKQWGTGGNWGGSGGNGGNWGEWGEIGGGGGDRESSTDQDGKCRNNLQSGRKMGAEGNGRKLGHNTHFSQVRFPHFANVKDLLHGSLCANHVTALTDGKVGNIFPLTDAHRHRGSCRSLMEGLVHTQ